MDQYSAISRLETRVVFIGVYTDRAPSMKCGLFRNTITRQTHVSPILTWAEFSTELQAAGAASVASLVVLAKRHGLRQRVRSNSRGFPDWVRVYGRPFPVLEKHFKCWSRGISSEDVSKSQNLNARRRLASTREDGRERERERGRKQVVEREPLRLVS